MIARTRGRIAIENTISMATSMANGTGESSSNAQPSAARDVIVPSTAATIGGHRSTITGGAAPQATRRAVSTPAPGLPPNTARSSRRSRRGRSSATAP